jgi:class 3 adenylate cyclase
VEDLSARLRVWAASAERTSERWLRQEASESATLIGVLLDLSERGGRVVVRLRGGAGTQSGTVGLVGSDFVVVGPALVPLAAIGSLAGPSTAGARDASAASLTFVAAVSRLAGEEVRVRAVLDSGDAVVGELGAGDGLLRIDTTWVPIAAVCALQVL